MGTNSFDSFMLFIMAGIIPGTNIVISPEQMLIAISLIAFFVVFSIGYVTISRYVSINRMARQYAKTSKPIKNGYIHA